MSLQKHHDCSKRHLLLNLVSDCRYEETFDASEGTNFDFCLGERKVKPSCRVLPFSVGLKEDNRNAGFRLDLEALWTKKMITQLTK